MAFIEKKIEISALVDIGTASGRKNQRQLRLKKKGVLNRTLHNKFKKFLKGVDL